MRKIIDYIKVNEGLELKPYKCTAGKFTIGYGRNLDDVGITKNEAEYLLGNDIQLCITDLKEIFENFDTYSINQRTALIDMRFNLGLNGFEKFKKFIKNVKNKDWEKAAKEIKNSKYYKQVKNRAERNMKFIKA